MSKYGPLEEFLGKQTLDRIPMRFIEIERLIGEKLPPSAYQHRPWWANEARGHSHAKAWLAAHYETAEVDMDAKKLVFARRSTPQAQTGRAHVANQKSTKAHHPIIGALKGMITIEPGYDLTEPAMPEWGDMIEKQDRPEER